MHCEGVGNAGEIAMDGSPEDFSNDGRNWTFVKIVDGKFLFGCATLGYVKLGPIKNDFSLSSLIYCKAKKQKRQGRQLWCQRCPMGTVQWTDCRMSVRTAMVEQATAVNDTTQWQHVANIPILDDYSMHDSTYMKPNHDEYCTVPLTVRRTKASHVQSRQCNVIAAVYTQPIHAQHVCLQTNSCNYENLNRKA